MKSQKNNQYNIEACKILHNNIHYFMFGFYTFDDFIEKTFMEWDDLILKTIKEKNNEL